MKNFSFKPLSVLLIVAILFVFVPVQQAEAGPVAVIIVAAVVVATVTAVDYYTCIINIFWGGCGSGGGLVLTPNPSECAFSYQPTFYIPQFSSTGANNDTNKQVAIYRFTLPANSDQTTLNNWYFNIIKANVGNGFTDLGWYSIAQQLCFDSTYWTAANATPLGIFSYDQACSGNVCNKVTDGSIPPDSYVAYVAKVLGDYSGARSEMIVEDYIASYCVYDVNKPNKFLNKDNSSSVVFPSSSGRGTLGNAVVGPIKTGSEADCAPPAPADFTAVPASCSQIDLNWSDVPAATNYWIGRSPNGSDNWTRVATLGDVNSWSDTSLSSNTRYYYRIEAVNSAGRPSSFAYADAITPRCPPGDFNLNLGGSVACNYVPLSWTVSPNADAYRILKGSPRVDITPYPYTALNFTDSTVSQNTSYIYQIEAYNSSGVKRSNTINVSTPYCPPTVNLSANSSSIFQGQSVVLSWIAYYVTSCIASNKWSGSKPLSGNETVIPSPPPSATYTLTCSGPGGSGSDTETIDITSLALPDWREVIPR